jgi:antitoxin (DNA-binding transcriptional repressor) of toxin-antitoxin stability system
MLDFAAMKTITVRELRQQWPRAEALLQQEKEIIVTRDGKPVARLSRIRESTARRKRFDPESHARWQVRTGGSRKVRWVEELLASDREAREPARPRDLHRQ